MDWLRSQDTAKYRSGGAALQDCLQSLREEVRIPLNVSCRGIVRGILTRRNDLVSVQGTAELHGKQLDFHSAFHPVAQLSTLISGMERAKYELDLGRPQEALAYLRAATQMLDVPSHAVRFPQRFHVESPGVCSEVFVCERTSFVANLHAYQDAPRGSGTPAGGPSAGGSSAGGSSMGGSTPGGYRATSTASAKSVDPALVEVSQKIDSILHLLS